MPQDFFFLEDTQVLEQELFLRLIGHIYFEKFVDRKFHICPDITC